MNDLKWRVTISDAERLWLTEIYKLFEKGTRSEPRVIKATLHGKLPAGFNHESLSSKGLCWGTEITLLGILQIQPDTEYISICHNVIQAILTMIQKQPDIEEIESSAIVRITGLPTTVLLRVVRLLRPLGNFCSGYSQRDSHLQSISVGREDVYDEYLSYQSIDLIIDKYIDRFKDGEKEKSIVDDWDLSKVNTNQEKLPSVDDIWVVIRKDRRLSKSGFAKKIKFVSEQFRRQIILRDVAHAYYLAYHGFYKPAVILAGSVIEELLRQYLIHNGLLDANSKSFRKYIEICKEEGILKSGTISLNESMRHFRNQVHMSKEKTKKDEMKEEHAINAVLSIFILIDDFN